MLFVFVKISRQGEEQCSSADQQATYLSEFAGENVPQACVAIAEPQAVLAWLITTVRRESWRVLKRDGRSIPVEEFPETEPDGLLAALDPAAEAMLREDQRVLWRAVSSLSERCQALLRIIAFIDRPDYGAVSEALGMPVGSIGPTRGRCLAKLRGQLAADPTWSTP